jgi:Domain of unknown function (DUF5664)
MIQYTSDEYVRQIERARALNELHEDRAERLTTSDTGAMKGVKEERYDLIAVEPIRLLSILLSRGAEKYKERNWELGYEWSKSYAALQRHANAFWSGEDYDSHDETCLEGCLRHTVCIIFHAMVLTEYMTTHREKDDRPQRRKPNE